jgi:hypothetical protein
MLWNRDHIPQPESIDSSFLLDAGAGAFKRPMDAQCSKDRAFVVGFNGAHCPSVAPSRNRPPDESLNDQWKLPEICPSQALGLGLDLHLSSSC